uniref:Uncharacterized protein n=1 Tax=Romanomermis culicivorax TaxID=13658 RepID=A0A915KHG2_ROMCU
MMYNPWNCDIHLVPFVEYIKSNYHLVTDAPGQIPSVCQHPPALSGIHLKHSDIAGSTGGIASSSDTPRPLVSTTDSVKYEESGGDHNKTLKRTNVSTIILSIILGILIVALILLLLVRYLKSKQRRDRKLDEETFRMNRMGQGQFTRRADSVAPQQGSAFPVESGPSASHREHNGVINRPWYHVLNFKV